MKHLSRYQSTQILLARDDVFQALSYALAAAPPEASAALAVYYTLSEVETGGNPPYLSGMKTQFAIDNLAKLSSNGSMSEEDKKKAEKLYAHLTT
jgi:hypothetical protein